MPQVGTVSHFAMCEHCGVHGNIHFKDGTISNSFVTKMRGLIIMRAAVRKKMLTLAESLVIEKEINRSPLPRVDWELDRFWDSLDEMNEELLAAFLELFSSNQGIHQIQ